MSDTHQRHAAVHRARRGDTRERIKRTAIEMFVERGYDGTSLREIAEKVEVTKAALYYHFKSKEDILQAVMEDAGTEVDELARWAREQPRGAATRREVLARYATLLDGNWSLMMRLMQADQGALRELRAQADIASRMKTMVGLLRDPDADAAGQLRAVLALAALHIARAPAAPDGFSVINATPEQATAAALAVADELTADR